MPKLIESYVPKQIQALGHGIKLPATIPANAGDIDAGQVMGVRTADDVLLPVRRCLLAVDAANAATTLNVGVANVAKFKVGDTVAIRTLDGATGQNLGAVTAVGAATITVTTALTAGHTANQSYVYVADGTEVAKAIMEYSVLNDTEAQQVSPFVVGVFYESELIGFDTLALADLAGRRLLNGLVKI